jgi:hypothetical protein
MFIRPLCLVSLLLAAAVHGQLVITEVNSDGTPADFWELTNFGAATVDLSNYIWIDDKVSPDHADAFTVPSGTSILAGESVLFVTSGTAADFRSAWNLSPSVKIILGGPGLGSNDAVYFYTPAKSLVASLNYADAGFTRSNGQPSLGGHTGASAGGLRNQSLILDPNFGTASRRYTFASGANFGSYAANPPFTGVGSPGSVGSAGMNSLPVFTSPNQTYWRASESLAGSPFRVVAVDTDPGQTLTMTVPSKPSWLTYAAVGPGTLSLGGTPPAGNHTFTVRATDSAVPPGVTEQTVTLTIFPTSSPIILNEYNAVAPTNFLRGGTATQDEDGVSPGPIDSHFGRVAGNGGEWVEFVVVGNGSAGSTVDMRGWTIQVLGSAGTRSVRLSSDPYWANVVAGTILTFTTANTAAGGLDTAIHKTSALHTGGYLWTNIWIFDETMVSQPLSTFTNSLGIDSEDTRFVIRNQSDVVVYGPSGEGVASSDPTAANSLLGVNSREILRLQQDPAPGVDPLFGNYNDASNSSTFGAPNTWGSGPTEQNFAAYKLAGTPPVFTSTPTTRAYGGYQYTVAATSPTGAAVTFSATNLPDFLTLTPGPAGTATLANHRPLTLADAGIHMVRIVASNGAGVAATTPQVFVLTVFHDAPSVILNEYNAVSPMNFLNGGNAVSDSSGQSPPSSDSHFGRIAGNGGRWFELVVVGDGGPSTVDMRGWTIEIGTTVGQSHMAANRLELSQHSYWAAVPAGTILTFIDRNTANGGLDTEINRRNRLTTNGDAWTNVWMGDPDLLVYPSASDNGYLIGAGVVSGIRIDQNDTQFILRNAAGRPVFGPVGEGIAPASGVSSTEVFELEDHPTPAISPLAEATDTAPGYDDGASGSTFGHPNRWHAGDGGSETEQDFTPFIVSIPASPYELWATSFGLQGDAAAPAADPDGDGRSNFAEYAFGGNPGLADDPPVPQEISRSGTAVTWRYLRRAGDPALAFVHQYSSDLAEWLPLPADAEALTITPHPELVGYSVVTVEIPATPQGSRFFRVKLP